MSCLRQWVRIAAKSLTGRHVEIVDRHGTGLIEITEFRDVNGSPGRRFDDRAIELTVEQIREILAAVEADNGKRRTP